jgi:hypothetical protein
MVEVRRVWMKLHSEELLTRGIRRELHVTCMGEERCRRVVGGETCGKESTWKTCDGRVLSNSLGRVWTALFWLSDR